MISRVHQHAAGSRPTTRRHGIHFGRLHCVGAAGEALHVRARELNHVDVRGRAAGAGNARGGAGGVAPDGAGRGHEGRRQEEWKMHVGHRHGAQRGNRRYAVREEAAAGVTLGECAVTSPPPAMPSATALRARERARGDARVLGIVGLEFCGHDSIR